MTDPHSTIKTIPTPETLSLSDGKEVFDLLTNREDLGLGSPDALLLQTHRRKIEAHVRWINNHYSRMDAMQTANILLAFFDETPLMTGISFWVGEEGNDLYFDPDHLEISILGENGTPVLHDTTGPLAESVGRTLEELFNDMSHTDFGLNLWAQGKPHTVDYTRENLPGILEAAYDTAFGQGTWILDRTSLDRTGLTAALPEANAPQGPRYRL